MEMRNLNVFFGKRIPSFITLLSSVNMAGPISQQVSETCIWFQEPYAQILQRTMGQRASLGAL